MKPRITYAEMKWLSAYLRIHALGEGARIGPYEILWINEDPPWVQIKVEGKKKMIRKGGEFPVELAGGGDVGEISGPSSSPNPQ